MKQLLVCAALAMLAAGCRTRIDPVVKKEPPKQKVRFVDGECSVHDYPMASDVPAGAKSLGWVKVRREETDDATFEKLREAICKKGGDGMSQLHWIRAPGASVADQPVELEANAWELP